MPFSGEEAMGRFMDLHELFHTYTNSKFGKQVRHCCSACSQVWWVRCPLSRLHEPCLSRSVSDWVHPLAHAPPNTSFTAPPCVLRWTTTPLYPPSPTLTPSRAPSAWAAHTASTCRWGSILHRLGGVGWLHLGFAFS